MLNKAFHAPLQKVLSDWVQLNSDNDYFSLLLRGGGGGGAIVTKTGHCRPASECYLDCVSLAG